MEQEFKDTGPADRDPGGDGSKKQRQDKFYEKKVMSSYMAIYETMQAGLKSPQALFDTFMREADLLETYKSHLAKYHEELNLICSKFKEAFADNDIERMVELYDDLEAIRMKNQFQ